MWFDAVRLPRSFGLLLISMVSASLLVVMSRSSHQVQAAPLVGLYEYQPTTAQRGQFGIAVMFLDWNDPQAVPLVRKFLSEAQQQRRLPLLSLEPFPDRAAGRSNGDLLGDVMGGSQDQRLLAIGRELANHPGPVLLRFAHEMDKPGQYPWSFADPSHYLRLYHAVHDKVSTLKATNIHWVWSPIGSPRADRYWPGDHYVDVIGLSIYASRAWNQDRTLDSFADILHRQQWLHRRYGRPLLVAEAGVSGPSADQRQWLTEALQTIGSSAEVCGLVYFQAPQPRWMPLPTGHEEWQLKPPALQWFLQQLPLSLRGRPSCVAG